LDTGFIEREAAALTCASYPSRTLIAVAAAMVQSRAAEGIAPELRHWHSRPGRPQPLSLRIGATLARLHVVVSGQRFEINDDEGGLHVELLDHVGDLLSVRVDGLDLALHAAWSADELDLVHGSDGWRFAEAVATPASASQAQRTQVTAPMPGNVVEVRYVDGAQVQAGDVVLVLEAMKMEHQIEAPTSGRIRQLSAVAGQQVGMRQALFEVDTETAAHTVEATA
jgi:acetyl-CoA/propionyl-CoA carboxylase biotin carboxyl carrier protein